MKLFSKRNKKRNLDRIHTHERLLNRGVLSLRREMELVNIEARTRLISLIDFLSLTNEYLEAYILIDDKPNKIFYLNHTFLDNFSKAELGYKISLLFEFKEFDMKPIESVSNNEEQRIEYIYNDYELFDLLEIIMLFSKDEKRNDIIKRINLIFEEEDVKYNINKNIITSNAGDDLRNLSEQLLDIKLREKLDSFYKFYDDNDFINSSKISAEVLNIIFSDEKIDKKEKIDEVINGLVNSIVSNEENIDKKRKELKGMVIDTLKNLQDLNNRIYNIRHTEKDRVKISNFLIYKMISDKNISLIELFISSLKDNFIISEDWEEIKDEYIKRYKIDKNICTSIPELEDYPDVIEPDDVPF